MQNKSFHEYYVPYKEVERALTQYELNFKGKTIYCNYNNPCNSTFVKYFVTNFDRLGLKRLIATNNPSRYRDYLEEYPNTPRYEHDTDAMCLDIFSVEDLNDYSTFISNHVTKLKGSGDIVSEECLAYVEQADIIVTNPLFLDLNRLGSLFDKHKKDFIITGLKHFPNILDRDYNIKVELQPLMGNFVKPDGTKADAINIIWMSHLN